MTLFNAYMFAVLSVMWLIIAFCEVYSQQSTEVVLCSFAIHLLYAIQYSVQLVIAKFDE